MHVSYVFLFDFVVTYDFGFPLGEAFSRAKVFCKGHDLFGHYGLMGFLRRPCEAHGSAQGAGGLWLLLSSRCLNSRGLRVRVFSKKLFCT